jgi:hypothetical protein
MLFDCFCDFCRYYSGNRMFFRSHVLEAGRRTNLSTKKRYSTSWCYIKSVILFVSKKNDGINTCDVISLKRPTMLMSYN